MGPSRPLRIVFAGTPRFAAVALEAIVAAGHDIVLVLTRVDKPAGRGRAVQESAVKQLARERGLPIGQPRSLRDEALQARLRALDADVMVVAAYGLILPAEVLGIPRHGCLNIHASLLPRWRGAAPIQRAIEAGDAETGITIMQMDEGLDTGPILLAEREAIRAGDSGGSLHERLAALGAHAIVEALERLRAGMLRPQPQPAQGITYAHKLGRADALVDWAQPARRIVDRVRAFDPVPGATAILERMPAAPIKLWSARAAGPVETGAAARPGTVLLAAPGRLIVACGDGAVELLELQRSGSRRLPAADFLRGCPIEAGERFVAGLAT
ncbi:MAG: methionyl-tRNA formyltransferase [Burkholderiaceae bacterium]|nr:methionyl-tRNA formyltransferase [Burkholderiaceae bacterium]